MNWKSSKEIAQVMQIRPSKVDQWKSKKAIPSVAERCFLANMLECAPSDFVEPKIVSMKPVGDVYKAMVYGHKIIFSIGMGAVDNKFFTGRNYHARMEEHLSEICFQKVYLMVGVEGKV